MPVLQIALRLTMRRVNDGIISKKIWNKTYCAAAPKQVEIEENEINDKVVNVNS